jgi:hypothetical protein
VTILDSSFPERDSFQGIGDSNIEDISLEPVRYHLFCVYQYSTVDPTTRGRGYNRYIPHLPTVPSTLSLNSNALTLVLIDGKKDTVHATLFPCSQSMVHCRGVSCKGTITFTARQPALQMPNYATLIPGFPVGSFPQHSAQQPVPLAWP